MEPSEFDLVNSVATRLGERIDVGNGSLEDGIDALGLVERVVVLTWWAKGIIDNGGFEYFYEGATDTLAVADAFDALGLGEAATACRRAHSLVPADVLAGGYEACREWMGRFDREELNALFEDFNQVIWGLDESLERTLAAYIREHGLSRGATAEAGS